jgi:hypothetical protein
VIEHQEVKGWVKNLVNRAESVTRRPD